MDHLYVHVPFCDGKCAYCAFYSVHYAPALADRYLDALEREFDRRAPAAPPLPSPETVYLGGGTPSILDADRLARLCRFVSDRSSTARLREWTLEANPGTLSPEKLAILRSAGVNRVSLGVQSLDDAVLARIGRRHRARDVEAAVRALRAGGFDNLGVDLIACLPGVNAAQWRRTLDRVLDLEVPHVSVYALSVEEGTVLARQARAGVLAPASDTAQLRALDAAERRLASGGYERYEISNYARPGCECLHNLACWRGCDYLGLGPAAASRVGLRRWTNAADLNAYAGALARGCSPPSEEETLSPIADAVERRVFRLRLLEGICSDDLAPLGDAESARWAAVFAELAEHGLTERRTGRWRLTRRGRNVADSVAAELMPA